MGNDRRHGKILVADDVTAVVVGVDDVPYLLIGPLADLLKPDVRIIRQHRRVNEDYAFTGDDEAYIGAVEIGFNKDVGSDLSNDGSPLSTLQRWTERQP